MDKEALNALKLLNMVVLEKVNSSMLVGEVHRKAVRDLFSGAMHGVNKKSRENIVDLAIKGSRQHRIAVKQLIFNILAGAPERGGINLKDKDTKKLTEKRRRKSGLNIDERDVDRILSGYYINYYGKWDEICSTTGSELISNKINKILIRSDSDLDIKLQKLAQIIYQECYGLGVLDEFLDLGIDENFTKVEEIAMSGSNQLSLKISGCNFKLDRINYPIEEIQKICNNLSRCSDGGGLSKNRDRIETELLDGSRVTLTCPPFNANYTLNVRLHYAGKLTIDKQVKLGSTTWEFQHFLDAIMVFRPRVLVMGGQGVGKSTDIRDLARRYPANTNVVTAETSYELELDDIPHLIVNKIRLGELPVEELMKALFRYNADCLILGEARDPSDVMLYSQMSKRQAFGTMSTWHSGDALEGLYDMANALVRGNFFKSLNEALEEICKSTDLVIVKRVAESGSKKEGLRHVYQVCEVPDYKANGDKELELRTLFQYDYDTWTFNNVNSISEEYSQILLKRVNQKNTMKILRSGDYGGSLDVKYN